MTHPTGDKKSITMPPLCAEHVAGSRIELRLPLDDPQLETYLAFVQLLLFDWVVAGKEIVDRAHGRMDRLQGVLNSIGCLACYSGEGFEHATKLLRRGLRHAAAVRRQELFDADWPIAERVRRESSELLRHVN